MAKFLSGRKTNLKLGITDHTVNDTVLQTIGKVGIGVTNAGHFSLYVDGPTNITGDTLVGGGLTVSGTIEASNIIIGGGGNTQIGDDIITRNLKATGITTLATASVSDLTPGRVVLAGVGGKLEDDSNLTYDGYTLNTGNLIGVGATFSGNVSIAGTLTYEDVTNVDAVGLVTAREGIRIPYDNKMLQIGLSDDLQLYHDSQNSYIKDNGTGSLKILGGNTTFMNAAENKTSAVFNVATSVDLYNNNILRLQTTGYGVTVYDTLQAPQLNITGVSTFAGNIDANGDLDVDGHTELDNVNVSGILTAAQFTGGGGGGGTVIGDDILTRNLNVTGVSTFAGIIDVNGGANISGGSTLDLLNVTGISTFGGLVSVGGTTGTDGQYLRSTGVGVTWSSFPTMRTSQSYTATEGQTTFNFNYNVSLLDVFLNGVKLTPSEYTASNGSTVVLNSGCFAGDTIDLYSYNVASTGSSGGPGPAGPSGSKGQKGEAGSGPGGGGAKGQKGEVGSAGSAGSAGPSGSKGQKGTSGNDGSAGSKGQKGQTGAGTSGAKGQKGTSGNDGSAGSKGQKGLGGSDGSDGSDGSKGQKGQTGAGTSGAKGQKGEVGSGGSAGAKGQKGVDGTNASGSKGQKGATGSGGSGVTTDSEGNTVAGENAGDNFSTNQATKNTIFGYEAGTDLNTGDYNVLIGYQAGANLTDSSNAVAIGYQALTSAGSSRNYQTAVGFQALYNNAHGQECTAVGYQALYTNNTGDDQCAFGHNSLKLSNGANNSAFGYKSLETANNGNHNSAFGSLALQGVNSGNYNSSLGYNAGSSLQSGSNNLILGNAAQASSNSISNEITLGNTSINHLRIPGIGVSFSEGGAVIAGVVTATSFSGDGSNLTGVTPSIGITTNLSGTFTASAGNPSTINTFTGYSSDDLVVEYTVYIKNGSDFQTQKLLAMRDGTTIHSTQFAVMFSSSLLVQCDATISSGNILLRATPETGVSGSTTYKVKREVM